MATAAAGTVTTTAFSYQNNAVVEERVNGTLRRSFVTDEAGSIIKLVVPPGQTDAGTYLVNWNGHGDALNLLRVNGDGTTTLANSYTHDTWGTPSTTTHNGIGDLEFRYLYVGQFDVQWDDTFGLGLHYMHARHYSPVLGRFLQPDPAAMDQHPHAYAAGNPPTLMDPTGLVVYMKDGGLNRVVSCGVLRNVYVQQACLGQLINGYAGARMCLSGWYWGSIAGIGTYALGTFYLVMSVRSVNYGRILASMQFMARGRTIFTRAQTVPCSVWRG